MMTTKPLEPPDQDTDLLAGILAWTQLFGPRPLSWQDLADLGLSLKRTEAQQYRTNQLTDQRRVALYQALFRAFPLLEADADQDLGQQVETLIQEQRQQVQRRYRTAQFLARLTEDGGPDPVEELAALLQRGREAATTWFPTQAAGRTWRRAPWPGESLALFFYLEPGGRVLGVFGKVLQRQDRPPLPALAALYSAPERYAAWWELADPVPVAFAGVAHIPGHSTQGKAAEAAVPGQSRSFFFWQFGIALTEMVHRFRKP